VSVPTPCDAGAADGPGPRLRERRTCLLQCIDILDRRLRDASSPPGATPWARGDTVSVWPNPTDP
jgi:hypothetical protein